jgi:glycosyltransferase involved in cell wall biosynthesis
MDDIDDLASAMRSIHDDPELRAHMKVASLTRAKTFTWAKMARRLLDLCVDTHRRAA